MSLAIATCGIDCVYRVHLYNQFYHKAALGVFILSHVDATPAVEPTSENRK